MCIVSTLTYGCQTWSLTSKNIRKLEITQFSIERSMKRKNHIKIEYLRKKLKNNIRVATFVRRQKWKWAGHIARLRDDRWTYRATFWYLSHLKRKKGRQHTRWSDDINKFLATKNFQKIATDRVEWERLQDTFALHGPRIYNIDLGKNQIMSTIMIPQ